MTGTMNMTYYLLIFSTFYAIEICFGIEHQHISNCVYQRTTLIPPPRSVYSYDCKPFKVTDVTVIPNPKDNRLSSVSPP